MLGSESVLSAPARSSLQDDPPTSGDDFHSCRSRESSSTDESSTAKSNGGAGLNPQCSHGNSVDSNDSDTTEQEINTITECEVVFGLDENIGSSRQADSPASDNEPHSNRQRQSFSTKSNTVMNNEGADPNPPGSLASCVDSNGCNATKQEIASIREALLGLNEKIDVVVELLNDEVPRIIETSKLLVVFAKEISSQACLTLVSSYLKVNNGDYITGTVPDIEEHFRTVKSVVADLEQEYDNASNKRKEKSNDVTENTVRRIIKPLFDEHERAIEEIRRSVESQGRLHENRLEQLELHENRLEHLEQSAAQADGDRRHVLQDLGEVQSLARSTNAGLAELRRSAESQGQLQENRLDRIEQSAAQADGDRRHVLQDLGEVQSLARSTNAALAELRRLAESQGQLQENRLEHLEQSAAQADCDRRGTMFDSEQAQSQISHCNTILQECRMLSSDLFTVARMRVISYHSQTVRGTNQTTLSASQVIFRRIESIRSGHDDGGDRHEPVRHARVLSGGLALDELFNNEYCTEKVIALLLNALHRRMGRHTGLNPLDLILSMRYFGLHVLDQKRLKFVLPRRTNRILNR